jgi:four helix bundle protein
VKRNHRSLRAWQQAVELVEDVYRLTASFPAEERFGLSMQMRRAAVSVPANIAEGCARKGTVELMRFLSIASGSLSELDTILVIAVRLRYAPADTATAEKIDQVSRLVLALAAALKRRA